MNREAHTARPLTEATEALASASNAEALHVYILAQAQARMPRPGRLGLSAMRSPSNASGTRNRARQRSEPERSHRTTQRSKSAISKVCGLQPGRGGRAYQATTESGMNGLNGAVARAVPAPAGEFPRRLPGVFSPPVLPRYEATPRLVPGRFSQGSPTRAHHRACVSCGPVSFPGPESFTPRPRASVRLPSSRTGAYFFEASR